MCSSGCFIDLAYRRSAQADSFQSSRRISPVRTSNTRASKVPIHLEPPRFSLKIVHSTARTIQFWRPSSAQNRSKRDRHGGGSHERSSPDDDEEEEDDEDDDDADDGEDDDGDGDEAGAADDADEEANAARAHISRHRTDSAKACNAMPSSLARSHRCLSHVGILSMSIGLPYLHVQDVRKYKEVVRHITIGNCACRCSVLRHECTRMKSKRTTVRAQCTAGNRRRHLRLSTRYTCTRSTRMHVYSSSALTCFNRYCNIAGGYCIV